MPELSVLLIVGIATFVGAFVQGCLGFGVGVVTAPVVTLMEPTLMPVAVLVLGAAFAAATTVHDWRDIDRNGVLLALVGRAPGMVLGVLVVAMLPLAVLEFVVAVSVIAAVLFSGRRVALVRTPVSLLLAGAASGFTGTAAGIGGPPMALLYQRADSATLRSTLGAFFATGAVGSLLLLALAGEAPVTALLTGLSMMPVLALGFALATVSRARLSHGWLRRGVLALSLVSAMALLARSFA